MQQKAQLIATLVHQPELIVVDEPFSGLDPVNTRLVKDILAEQTAAGRTIIMSTHQMYQVEALCSRIALIDHGRTVLYGAVDEIKRSFAGNAVTIHGEGDFTGLPGVLEARMEDGDWRLSLAPGRPAAGCVPRPGPAAGREDRPLRAGRALPRRHLHLGGVRPCISSGWWRGASTSST